MGTATVSTGTMKGRAQDAWGARRISLFTVTMSNSYATNGDTFIPKAFGHQGKADRVIIVARYSGAANGTKGRSFLYDLANQKIVAIVDATAAEVANATDLSGSVLDVLVISD